MPTSKESNKFVYIDDILIKFRVLDRYHLKILVLLLIGGVVDGGYCINYVFVADQVDYGCKPSNSACVVTSTNTSVFKDQCHQRVSLYNDTVCNDADDYKLIPCEELIYENPYSLVAEFQLGCEEWKRTLIGTIHSAGLMSGLLFTGPLSDRFGRKTLLITNAVLGGIIGTAKSFSSNYLMYVSLEFLEAAFGDSSSALFIISVEMVAAENRVLFLTLSGLGHYVGKMILVILAWNCPSWRTLTRALYVPSILFISYIFLIDESPRWLLTKNRKDEAVAIIKKAAKKNKIELDKKDIEHLTYDKDIEERMTFGETLKTTLKSTILLKRFLICLSWWTTSTFVVYGVTINSVFLSGNRYLNFILMTILVDLPTHVASHTILWYFNRKAPFMFAFVGAAVCFGIQPFLPSNPQWLSIVVYFMGRFFSNMFFTITYIYTSELFPTYTRNSMHALCSSLGRVGNMLAPQTPLLIPYWSGLPSIMFAAASLIAAGLTLLVPDGGNDTLPDSVRQAERTSKTRL